MDAVDYAKRGEPESEYVITVHLMTRTEPWKARLRLISVADARCIGELTISFPSSKPEEGVPEMSRQLISSLGQVGINGQARPEFYEVPEGLSLADFSGEREILAGNLNLCLACPRNTTTRLLLAQTALAMKKVRPDVFRNFGSGSQISTLSTSFRSPLTAP